jgi:mannosylglycerate hydrolase
MQLFLYVHTHWDREWYLPFESFRCQLPALLDKVLSGLDDGSLPNFYLDGQAAIITDALEIAPHLESRIKQQMAAGKLSAGPWYILADQMLVSGESLIRNLKLGLKTTSKFGPPAMIGYCPDTFGHSQDLPRILAGFGINNAIVWRGVGKVESNPVFWWQSPDGSRVLTYHLNRGYYQTQFHESKNTDDLSKSLKAWLNHSPETNHLANSYCSFIDGALCPVGGDHIFPPKDFCKWKGKQGFA